MRLIDFDQFAGLLSKELLILETIVLRISVLLWICSILEILLIPILDSNSFGIMFLSNSATYKFLILHNEQVVSTILNCLYSPLLTSISLPRSCDVDKVERLLKSKV